MRDLTKLETATLLRRLKACDGARRWAKGMTLRRAWTTCPRGDWLGWLADKLGVRMAPEAWRAYDEAMDAARRAYNEATAAARRAYAEATAPAWRAALPYDQIRDAARAFLAK